jgi:4'-phosphopantetheinyl transferase EntD
MSIEAMKQALAKFEHLWEIGIDAEYKVDLLHEIRILRQAIEEAEKQEHNDKETVMNYDDIKIVFTLKQIHFILDSLGKMPYSQTAALYENIQKITAKQMPNPNSTNL